MADSPQTQFGVSISQVLTAIRPTQQMASPTTGQTVIITETQVDADLWLTPAGTLASLTVQLPNGFAGQRVTIASNQAITALAVTFPSGTVYNPLTTLSIGDAFEMVRVGGNIWVHPV